MVIETRFALIEDGELSYRGRPVVELAAEPFETVAHWALTGEWDATARFSPGAGLDAARASAAALPPAAGSRDRQVVAVTALAAADPLRASLDPAVVASAAERLVAGMVEVLPGTAPDGDEAETLAGRLFRRLAAAGGDNLPSDVALLNSALVLLLDHDMAVSTLAARAAASARATPYGVVTAGMGALDSSLHGNASRAAHQLLERVADGADPARAMADAVVTTHGPVPGFGQPLYPDGDPRRASC